MSSLIPGTGTASAARRAAVEAAPPPWAQGEAGSMSVSGRISVERIVLELEIPGDSRSLFRLRVDNKGVSLPLPVATLVRRLAAKDLRAGDINAFIDIEARQRATVPLMVTSAECGFPSPADDYLDRPLDFNDLLIENPAATFAVRIAG